MNKRKLGLSKLAKALFIGMGLLTPIYANAAKATIYLDNCAAIYSADTVTQVGTRQFDDFTEHNSDGGSELFYCELNKGDSSMNYIRTWTDVSHTWVEQYSGHYNILDHHGTSIHYDSLACRKDYSCYPYSMHSSVSAGNYLENYVTYTQTFSPTHEFREKIYVCNNSEYPCEFQPTDFIYHNGQHTIYGLYNKRVHTATPGVLASSGYKQIVQQLPNLAATLNLGDGYKTLLLKDGTYLRYSLANSRLEKDIRLISKDFKGITPAQAQSIVATVSLNSKVYFFLNNGTYLSYDTKAKQIDAGYPHQINADFTGVSNSDAVSIVSVLRDPKDNLIFLLNNGNDLLFDTKAKVVANGYPHQISADFPGITQEQALNIQTVYQF